MKKLGFGLMRLPMKNAEEIDQEQLNQMVDEYLDNGFTYFDTSYVYHNGASELAICKALVKRHERSSFNLASKLPAFAIQKEEEVEKIFHEQLNKCGVDYFDYFLLHNVNKILYNTTIPSCKMFEHMKDWKEKGLIRHLGFSFHDDAKTLDLILSEHPEVEFVQIAFNYYDMDAPFIQAKACYDVICKHNCKVIVMEPVKGGMLANVDEKTKACMKDGSPASYAIRYCAGFDNVLTVLSGMSNLEQLRDNMSYMKDFVPLKEDDQKIIESAITGYKEKWPIKESFEGTIHGIPCQSIVEAYNSCQIQPVPTFAAELNYLKGQLYGNGYDIHNIPKTEGNETVIQCENWLAKNTF